MKTVLIAGYADSLTRFRKPLIRALLDEGHKVEVMAPSLTADSPVYIELTALGVRCHAIPMDRTGMNPLMDTYTFFVLIFRLLQIRQDYLLAYTVKPIVYGLIAAFLTRVPARYALVTGLGYAFQCRAGTGKQKVSHWIVSLFYKIALGVAHGVFFQNPDNRAFFMEKGILSAKTPSYVIRGSGVELDRYPFTPLSTKTMRFLYIGRLIIDKGICEFVEAAAIVKGVCPQAECIVVGSIDSNPRSVTQSELDEWIAQGNIIYKGEVEDVRPIIAESTVFVLPSYSEGTSRAVLEAMSMGRPIITTDAAGCRQTVNHGENGFLVPVRDSQSLASIMLYCIARPQQLPIMGIRSRVFAEQHYDVNLVNKIMLQKMRITTYVKESR